MKLIKWTSECYGLNANSHLCLNRGQPIWGNHKSTIMRSSAPIHRRAWSVIWLRDTFWFESRRTAFCHSYTPPSRAPSPRHYVVYIGKNEWPRTLGRGRGSSLQRWKSYHEGRAVGLVQVSETNFKFVFVFLQTLPKTARLASSPYKRWLTVPVVCVYIARLRLKAPDKRTVSLNLTC